MSTWTPVKGPYTTYAAQGPGTLSNSFFLIFVIGIVALIGSLDVVLGEVDR